LAKWRPHSKGARETVVEKTDTTKETPRQRQAGENAAPAAKRSAKKSTRKAGKAAAAAGKPKKSAARKSGAKKGRKRTDTAAVEDLAIAKEEIAARRLAGGEDTRAAPGAAPGAAPASAPASAPSNPTSIEANPEAAVRVPDTGKRAKAEPRTRPGGNAEGSSRPNTLVPTNGIHTTERRIKRKLHQNRGVMGLIAATLLGIIILGEQTTPPNLTEFEQAIAASQVAETYAGARVADSPPGIIQSTPRNPPAATPDPEAEAIRAAERLDKILSDGELVEMERLLARLDLGPSSADGIVDNQTESAIRLYQEIAGLPIDGAPSRSLLADIREVVKILEDGG